jgi:prepilin-type N-terminal cleavage/methylation domain-containing protein
MAMLCSAPLLRITKLPQIDRQAGFTLIELIAVLVILGIIAAMASQMLAEGLSSYMMGKKVIDANWQGQVGIERMIRDLRMVRSANDISINTGSEFAFVDMTGTTIDYKLSGTNLLRNTQVLANGITSLAFTYYDKAGASGATAANTHYVKFAFTVTQNNVNYNLSTMAFLRDLSS